MQHRTETIQHSLSEHGLDGLLVLQAKNRQYLSSTAHWDGYVLLTASEAFIITDPRFPEKYFQQAQGFQLHYLKGKTSQWLAEILAQYQIARLGFEPADISYKTYENFKAALADTEVKLVAAPQLVEDQRVIKDTAEISLIQRAAAISDGALNHIAEYIKPGITEAELAWKLERFMRENGSEGLPFEIIVASGKNSALPHHRPSEKTLEAGEPLVIDLGAQFEGYASDCTRTFCVGKADATYQKIYDTVLAAQLAAIATITSGMDGHTADAMARTIIEEAGYGEAFLHGLGHGIGLNVHEAPVLSRGVEKKLANGMVFSVEPGIYLPEWGGVRVEDTVMLKDGRIQVITKATK